MHACMMGGRAVPGIQFLRHWLIAFRLPLASQKEINSRILGVLEEEGRRGGWGGGPTKPRSVAKTLGELVGVGG